MEEYGYVVNVDCVVSQDEEYLLIKRGQKEDHASGTVAFPGGKIEEPAGSPNPIEKTAAREVSEEVGLEIRDIEYVLSKTFEADDGTKCINIVVLCERVRGEAYPRASDEVASVVWLSHEEISNRDDVPAYIQEYTDRVVQFRDPQ